MVASLSVRTGLREVIDLRLVPNDADAARRLDDAVAAYRPHGCRVRDRDDTGQHTPGAVRLPGGFGTLAPGPALGAVLAEVPVRRVSGHDTVDVMAAAYRQACHAQSVFLRALLETGMRRVHSGDGVARVESPGEFAAEEARAALVWSRRRADSTFEFAWQVHERLPMLGEAMEAGVLDEPRARAFVQWTIGLSDDQAAQVIAGLLPVAGGLLVGALIDRVKRAAIAVDPGWAERRYRAAVKGRRVEGSRNDDGTANLHGLDLPIDRAAAACDRIDTLARACKHAGDARPIDHIRADLYLGLLDGTFEVFTDDQIIDHVLRHPFTDVPGPATTPGHGDSGHGGDGPDDGSEGGADDDGRGDDGRGDDGPGSAPDVGGPQAAVDSVGDSARSGHVDHTGERGSGEESPPLVEAATPDRQHTSPEPAVPGAVPSGWSVRELRAEVATLLGLNEHPAEIAGWDIVPAALARPMLASMRDAQWRWVVCDHDGHPIGTGITRRRPAPSSGSAPPAPVKSAGRGRSAIVELQVKADELPQLIAAGRRLGWDGVLADISAQHATNASDDAASDDPLRRHARTQLRRVVQVRDRCCTHPACRAPASRTDQDHAIDHAHGGATDEANLGCCCRHDHRLKHDGGWLIIRSAPDTTIWTSPLGHTYVSRPPPVMPSLPASCPAAEPAPPHIPGAGVERAPAPDAPDLLAIPDGPEIPPF